VTAVAERRGQSGDRVPAAGWRWTSSPWPPMRQAWARVWAPCERGPRASVRVVVVSAAAGRVSRACQWGTRLTAITLWRIVKGHHSAGVTDSWP
jgi:hypothetical protein